MSSLARPSGPLPPSVYWRRRAIVLSVALLLVVAVAKVLTLGSDASSDAGDQGAVNPAAGGTTGTTPAATDETTKPKKKKTKKPKPTKTPLPEPDGPCTPSDVTIQPVIDTRHASDAIRLKMKLTTRVSDACLFTVDADTVTLKITSGDDLYWTSADCPAQVPSKELVLRRTEQARVDLIWNGKRSGEQCTKNTDWALPGYYHLAASALGGEPASDQFELRPPKPVKVTESPKPDKDKKKDKGKKNRG